MYFLLGVREPEERPGHLAAKSTYAQYGYDRELPDPTDGGVDFIYFIFLVPSKPTR